MQKMMGQAARGGRPWAVSLALLASALCGAPTRGEEGAGERHPDAAVHRRAVVAADHPLASAAGRDVLRQGGNVVDAAVATSFALSVVRPSSCGLGGGGFLLFYDAERGEAVALDYRERAPASARREMFASPRAREEQWSRTGGRAVAVPGTVAGLCEAARRYGRLPLADLLAPAIRLAEEGVVPDAHQRAVQRQTVARFRREPELIERFPELWERYLNAGEPWSERERFHSPQLPVLRRIAAEGADAFYRGAVADSLVAAVADAGGGITRDDLADTRPVVRKPLVGRHAGAELWTMPPPSSGGVALLQTLNTLNAWREQHAGEAEAGERAAIADRSEAERAHLLVEALKHAFADRARWLGDRDFVDVPVEQLTSGAYARRLARRIDLRQTHPPEHYGRHAGSEDGGTSHLSVIDAEGNAVACTETINTYFGSWVVDPEYGIVLNNEMDDFTAAPGEPNAFGLIQSEANAIAPGKKPLSSMSPTIAVREGRAVAAVGGSGGPRIITATLQVLRHLIEDQMPPWRAVRQPRLHHQWQPDSLLIERELVPTLAESLAALGHSVEAAEGLATVQAAARDEDGVQGASDPRKHGRAAGW